MNQNTRIPSHSTRALAGTFEYVDGCTIACFSNSSLAYLIILVHVKYTHPIYVIPKQILLFSTYKPNINRRYAKFSQIQLSVIEIFELNVLPDVPGQTRLVVGSCHLVLFWAFSGAVSRGSGCYEFETSGYGQIVKEDISSSGRFWHIFRIHSVQLSVV